MDWMYDYHIGGIFLVSIVVPLATTLTGCCIGAFYNELYIKPKEGKDNEQKETS